MVLLLVRMPAGDAKHKQLCQWCRAGLYHIMARQAASKSWHALFPTTVRVWLCHAQHINSTSERPFLDSYNTWAC